MERAEKQELVSALNAAFGQSGVIVVAQYNGLTVAEMQAFRRNAKAAGATVKVAKNRLARLALQGTDAAHIADLFTGPTVIAYSGDPVAASKVAVDYAKGNDKLVILGGAMGQTNLNPDGVKALAELPSLDELRARIVGVIQAPAAQLARTVAAPASSLARVIGAFAKKDEAA